jgi:glutaredoxin 2
MTAALKHLRLEETVVLDDDSDTMVRLVGKRQIPILVKDDGEAMLESMAMVGHLENIGEVILRGPQRPEIATWADAIAPKLSLLTWPRYPLLGLPEFGTTAALEHYNARKHKAVGDLVALRANTSRHMAALIPDLEELDALIEHPDAVNGKLSLDDVLVLPLLRSAAVVKELRFPAKVRGYFDAMMDRVGYQALPVI